MDSTIKFGCYEQDNNISNGKEEIEWDVLKVEENKALIVSKYALDCQRYNGDDNGMTWEECTLRKWLNETFYNVAFGSDHKKRIVSTSVNTEIGSDSKSSSIVTDDNIFLLSEAEVNRFLRSKYNFLNSNNVRKCKGTEYCYSLGAYKDYEDGNCIWWLRSFGNSSNDPVTVNPNSDYVQQDADRYDIAVRPALWLYFGS